MEIDRDKVREYYEAMGMDNPETAQALLDKLMEANGLLLDGHKLLVKSKILIDKTLDAIRDHQNEVQLPTLADIKLYHTVSTTIEALGFNREND